MRRLLKGRARTIEIFYRALSKWWIKFGLWPLLVAGPPGLLAYWMQNGTASVLPVPSFVQPFLGNPYAGFFGPAWIWLFTLAYAFIETKSKEGAIDVGHLLSLFKTLEKIVEAKAKRFGEYAKRMQAGLVEPDSAVFSAITQPEQQIAKISEGLHAFFEAIDKRGASFRVGIVVIRDNVPVEWLYFSPESQPPRTPMSTLQSPESTICRCVESRHIVIVEDVKAEIRKSSGRRYVPGSDVSSEGSQLCYPVVHHYTDSIPYVIAIAVDRRGYFRQKQRPLYEWIIEHFAVRLGLEQSLSIIKERVQDGQKITSR